MLLDIRDLQLINSWHTITLTINGIVTDFVHINFGKYHIDINFDFPRQKSFYYNNNMKDYVFFYNIDYEFIQLKEQLIKNKGKKFNKYFNKVLLLECHE